MPDLTPVKWADVPRPVNVAQKQIHMLLPEGMLGVNDPITPEEKEQQEKEKQARKKSLRQSLVGTAPKPAPV